MICIENPLLKGLEVKVWSYDGFVDKIFLKLLREIVNLL